MLVTLSGVEVRAINFRFLTINNLTNNTKDWATSAMKKVKNADYQ